MILGLLWDTGHPLSAHQITKAPQNIYGAGAKHNTWSAVQDISHIQ